MIFMYKIQEAVNFSLKAHQGQKRKTRDVDYIMHPLTVALILARSGAKQDVVVAGLLHDVIEDTTVTKEQIEMKFGHKVAEIVNDVTEQDKSLPWEERKELAFRHIFEMCRDSLLVKSADVLHNISDSIDIYDLKGEEMFKHFNASKEKQLARYERIIKALQEVWPEDPLLPDLKEDFQQLREMWS